MARYQLLERPNGTKSETEVWQGESEELPDILSLKRSGLKIDFEGKNYRFMLMRGGRWAHCAYVPEPSCRCNTEEAAEAMQYGSVYSKCPIHGWDY